MRKEAYFFSSTTSIPGSLCFTDGLMQYVSQIKSSSPYECHGKTIHFKHTMQFNILINSILSQSGQYNVAIIHPCLLSAYPGSLCFTNGADGIRIPNPILSPYQCHGKTIPSRIWCNLVHKINNIPSQSGHYSVAIIHPCFSLETLNLASRYTASSQSSRSGWCIARVPNPSAARHSERGLFF